MTPLELRERGYQVLVEHLGQVEAIRFLQQAGWGQGNYTQERGESLDSVTQEEFWQDLERVRARKTNLLTHRSRNRQFNRDKGMK